MESDTTKTSVTASTTLTSTVESKASESVTKEEAPKKNGNGNAKEADASGDIEQPPNKRLKGPEHVDGDKEEHEAESTQSNLRSFKRIPVFIVDYHNDVLEFIYRCLATRHLPLEKNILVHFDSHPDLVIARDIPASASYDKETMLTELSIENWIMPTLYAGHFDRMVWLKNSWCQQLPTGTHRFKVGHKNDRIGVNCALDYFIADGNYCSSDELLESREIELQVYDADTAELDPMKFISSSDANSFILDIDLDFFSTSNPFLEIYKDADCYSQLKEIFHFESVEERNATPTAENEPIDYSAIAAKRQLQLEALRQIFWHLEEKRTFEGLEPVDKSVIPDEIFAKIVKLAKLLQSKYADDEIDWLLIFDSGSTTDNNGLPHHISTTEQLEEYFGYFKKFLQRLPVPPVAITIAHSAQDDYCPQNQVAHIEEQVLRVLREVFGERIHEQPILHYMDDEWDVMQL